MSCASRKGSQKQQKNFFKKVKKVVDTQQQLCYIRQAVAETERKLNRKKKVFKKVVDKAKQLCYINMAVARNDNKEH